MYYDKVYFCKQRYMPTRRKYRKALEIADLSKKMEEIEEYKNSENNSNYISDSNHRTKTHDQGDNIDINENNEKPCA